MRCSVRTSAFSMANIYLTLCLSDNYVRPLVPFYHILLGVHFMDFPFHSMIYTRVTRRGQRFRSEEQVFLLPSIVAFYSPSLSRFLRCEVWVFIPFFFFAGRSSISTHVSPEASTTSRAGRVASLLSKRACLLTMFS